MFDWEESVFVGLKKLWHRVFVRPRELRRKVVRATLQERRQTLLLLAQAIAAKPLMLFESDDRQLCAGDRIFLPSEFAAATKADENAELFTIKAIVAALAMRHGWHGNSVPLCELVRFASAEFPGLGEKTVRVQAALPPNANLWDLLGRLPDSQPSCARETHATVLEGDERPEQVTTELRGKGQANVEVLPAEHLDDPGAEMPEHVFEKVEALEEYQGTPRKTDDDDSLKDHEEALRELDMRQLLRTPERPRSIYRSDVILDGFGFEAGGDAPAAGIPYPEWNHREGRYQPDWCHILASCTTAVAIGWSARAAHKHRALIRRLRRQFATLRSEMQRLRRQPVGPDFDLDAVIDAEVQRRTGHTPPESIYTDTRREPHDIAALILLDQSYSTDAWLDGVRVLDVITETILCVGEVLHDAIEKFAIAGFTSNTRRNCRFALIKDFAEPWTASRDRLGAQEPAGYTRIGPALRHVQELLAREKARRKIILLVTDGRPCDYDRYEGQHGIKDVGKAIETGRLHGIQTHAFAVEKQAAEFFPAMFTRHSYDIVPTPSRLADSMCEAVRAVARRVSHFGKGTRQATAVRFDLHQSAGSAHLPGSHLSNSIHT